MKFLKYITICLALSLFSCGSSEKVITDSGEVYTIKGNKIFSNGDDVTQTLSTEKKDKIMSDLNTRLAAEKKAEEAQEALEKRQKELRDAQKEAERKERDLEKKQEAIEKRQRNIDNARKDYLRAKEKLADKEEKFTKLKDEGKLSPVEIEEYNADIAKLKINVTEAKLKLDKAERS